MASEFEKPINGSYFILQFDKEVENRLGRSSLIQSGPKHQKLLRGTLLEPVSIASQWQEPRRGQRGNGKVIRLRRPQSGPGSALEVDCFASEVARITKDEMELLSAISTDNERYRAYYEPNQLKNALALRKNMHVNVEVKCDTMKQIMSGIVRYIGPLPGERGRQFGIELHVGIPIRNLAYFDSHTVFIKVCNIAHKTDCRRKKPPKFVPLKLEICLNYVFSLDLCCYNIVWTLTCFNGVCMCG